MPEKTGRRESVEYPFGKRGVVSSLSGTTAKNARFYGALGSTVKGRPAGRAASHHNTDLHQYTGCGAGAACVDQCGCIGESIPIDDQPEPPIYNEWKSAEGECIIVVMPLRTLHKPSRKRAGHAADTASS